MKLSFVERLSSSQRSWKMIVLGYYETILCREVVLFPEVMENDRFGIL